MASSGMLMLDVPYVLTHVPGVRSPGERQGRIQKQIKRINRGNRYLRGAWPRVSYSRTVEGTPIKVFSAFSSSKGDSDSTPTRQRCCSESHDERTLEPQNGDRKEVTASALHRHIGYVCNAAS